MTTTNEFGPEKSVIVMDPGVPPAFHAALEILFAYPSDEERAYIARGWSRRHLSADSPMPTPLVWIVSASSLSEAQTLSDLVRDIVNDAMLQEQSCDLSGAEVAAIYAMVMRRVRVLTIHEAFEVLEDLGIPVYYAPGFHALDEVTVVPFSLQSGFSPQHYYGYMAQLPAVIL